MIDNKLLTNQPNVQKQPPPSPSPQQPIKANTQYLHSDKQPKVEEDQFQQSPKVIRNSSSQYDAVLDKHYKNQPQNDAKSTLKEGKNHRELKQQIGYIRDSTTNTLVSIYFIATKQSNSGVFSHQRFFAVNLNSKQLMYYTNVPYLPIQNLQQISEKPKEVLKLHTVQKLQISNPKKGIGQLQIRWVQQSESKLWKLKLGNTAMSKEFVQIVQSIKANQTVVVDQREKSKEKIMKSLNSPRNKSPANTKILAVKRKDVSATKSGVSDLSNLLLKSIMFADQFGVEPPRKVSKGNQIQKDKLAKKQAQKEKQEIKVEGVKIKHTISQKVGEIQSNEPKHIEKQTIVINKQAEQLKPKEAIKQVAVINNSEQQNKQPKQQSLPQPIVKPQSNDNPQIIENKALEKQSNLQKPSQMANVKNQNVQSIPQKQQGQGKIEELKPPNSENHINSAASIKLQQIINNATIQYQEKISKASQEKPPPRTNQEQTANNKNKPSSSQPVSLTEIQHPRKSQLESMIQRRREIQQDSVQTQKIANKKGQLQQSKVMINSLPKKTNSKADLQKNTTNGKSKTKMIDNIAKSRPKEDLQYFQSMAKPTLTPRQYLLDQRKYAQTVTLKVPDPKSPKFINQHNHPRRQKSRSSSVSSNIEEYLLKQKQTQQNQKGWLFKWLTTTNPLERGSLYKQIVEYCRTKVIGLANKFNSWHLFHKEGQKYIAKEGQIQLHYTMLASQNKIEQYLNKQISQNRKFKELSFLWNMTDGGKQISKQHPVIIGAACIINYKGLQVFCRLDVSATKLGCRDVSQSAEYGYLFAQIARKCHSKIRNITLYQFILDKKKYLYIDSIEVQPFIENVRNYFINQQYAKNYVSGVICVSSHLEQILQHSITSLIPELITLLIQFTPLTTLELQTQMNKLGLDISMLPLALEYCTSNQKNRQSRLIISQFCAQLLAQHVRKDIHSLLLGKNADKNVQEEIYGILMRNLRLDDESVCQAFWMKYQLKLSLQQIRHRIVDEYVISSLFIKLGIKCSIKQHTELLEIEKKKGIFWRQFQFNEQSVTLKWDAITSNFDPLPFHQLKSYFSSLFQANQGTIPRNEYVYDRKHLIQRLSVVNNQPYRQSWFFYLLTTSQKQLINSIIAQQESILVSADWEQQTHPFYHLHHHSSAYYYTIKSFEQMLSPLRQFIAKQMYQQARRLLGGQLVRAWIWGSLNSKLLVKIELLRSELNELMGNHNESLQSILMALQIGIKRYEQKQIRVVAVLQLCFRAAGLHVRCHKYSKAVELYEICGVLFEKAIQESEDKKKLFQRYLLIYNQKARLCLKVEEYQKLQQCVKANMLHFFSCKDKFQQQSDILTTIYAQQFQAYCILFRSYQLAGKLIEQIQLMQDCSVKFIENYFQIMNGQDLTALVESQQMYFLEILKNIWLAVVSNSNHTKIPSFQQYFNYYYAPLRNIKLQVIKMILIKLRKIHKGLCPLEKMRAMQQMFEFLAKKTKICNQGEQKQQKKRPKSILVVGVIDCLSLLSNSQHGLLEKPRSPEVSELLMLQQMVSILGFQFAIGAIESCINACNTQL